MKLHVLGSAGYHGNGFRETTCLVLPEVGIVLDAGSGFRRMRPFIEAMPKKLPLSVLLSHTHIDHCIGLTYGISLLLGTERTINVYGDIKHTAAASEYLFHSPLFPLGHEEAKVNFGTLDFKSDAWSTVNKVRVRTQPLPHPGGSTGYRLALPKGDLVFITDTCADHVPRRFVRGAKTLIHECTFSDQYAHLAEPSGHSHTSQVLRLAEEAGVERLVLVHLNNIPELLSGKPITNLPGDIPHNVPFEVVVSDDNTVLDA